MSNITNWFNNLTSQQKRELSVAVELSSAYLAKVIRTKPHTVSVDVADRICRFSDNEINFSDFLNNRV